MKPMGVEERIFERINSCMKKQDACAAEDASSGSSAQTTSWDGTLKLRNWHCDTETGIRTSMDTYIIIPRILCRFSKDGLCGGRVYGVCLMSASR